MDPDELRRALVERLIALRAARSPAVVRALSSVPRHLFLPEIPAELAYADRPIALMIEDGVTISSASQPSMIAEMLEQLGVRRGDRVLEIGTGSGYTAALLAHLCGTDGSVVTIELDPLLVERARRALRTAGFDRVRVLLGDGAGGVPDYAPFDRIILTVAADDILEPWRTQLVSGGRLVLPLTLRALQESIAFEGSDPLYSVSIVGASFVTLRGARAVAPHEVDLESTPGIRLRVGDPARLDVAALSQYLKAEPAFVELGEIQIDDLWSGLDVWLDAHLEDAGVATAIGGGTAACVDEWLSVVDDEPRYATTFVLCRESAIGFFVRNRRRVGIASYGDAAGLIDRARAAIARWIERGKPPNSVLKVSAHARTSPPPVDALITKPSVTLALRWTRR
jgi:protein-L-isoaspartate(D-aspartate) O-methyltransferase